MLTNWWDDICDADSKQLYRETFIHSEYIKPFVHILNIACIYTIEYLMENKLHQRIMTDDPEIAKTAKKQFVEYSTPYIQKIR